MEGAANPTEVYARDGVVWWSESRPNEGGRIQIVRWQDGSITDLLPDGYNARSRVHEYGGGAWWVSGDTVFFCNWEDQRIHRLDPGGSPIPITPEPPSPHAFRYADGAVTEDGAWIFAVQEDHTGEGEARNEIVVLPTDGSDEPVVVASGFDFMSDPRPSPGGTSLVWVAWNHPNMPWDTTELWRGSIEDVDGNVSVTNARRIAGGDDESVIRPVWGPRESLYAISDRTDWWNVYGVHDADAFVPIHPVDADGSVPPWVFGRATYGVGPSGDVYTTYVDDGVAQIARVSSGTGRSDVYATERTSIGSVCIDDDRIVAIATSPDREPEVVIFKLRGGSAVEQVVKRGRDLGLDGGMVSHAIAITFPSGDRTAHANYYAPMNSDVEGPAESKPPLLVMGHGGPTASAKAGFDASIQFWTSRGFAVVDVDYGGSAGYGRSYRKLLEGRWGIVDVEDCCAAAEYLVRQGLVDRDRLAIRGASAGGYTTLAALAFTDTFHVGANHFGVSDIASFAEHTHKFESRYIDGLIGPYPEAADIYRERSPLHHLDGFDCPLITFQGLEDVVVPPDQSEVIMRAIDDRGIPNAYLTFEGEQHGFRKADTIVRVLDAELSFYGQVFGFTPSRVAHPVDISHADAISAA